MLLIESKVGEGSTFTVVLPISQSGEGHLLDSDRPGAAGDADSAAGAGGPTDLAEAV
jgi:hypothetical protein